MAIKANDSNKEVVRTNTKYTGKANVVVQTLNPTWDELKKNNPNAKEPKYLEDESSEAVKNKPAQHFKKHRLHFTVYHPETKTYAPLTFWLESRPRWNKAGTKVEWINIYGNTCWSDSETELSGNVDWFDNKGARPALNGEKSLTDFIKAWANVNEGEQAYLDDPKKIAEGDLGELKTLLSVLKNNKLTVLLGVNKVEKDGKTTYYQGVYPLFFARTYDHDNAAWKSQLEGEYGTFRNHDWQNDFTLKPYNPQLNIDTPSTFSNGSSPQSPTEDVTGEPRYTF